MVRCIPTFVILGLIASLTLNHPISIDNVDEIVETAGVQAIEDDVFSVNNNGLIEAVPTDAPFSIANEAEDIEENNTAGVQAVVDENEEDVVAGIQGVEDVEENDVGVAEATPTEVVAQAATQQDNDSNDVMEFELFEDTEGDSEITPASVIDENINDVQNNTQGPNTTDATVYENLALEALNRLKILHIFRSNILNFGKKRESESESENNEEETQPIFDVDGTEAPTSEVVTEAPEEIATPSDIVEEEIKQPKHKKSVDENCDNEVEIALFEVESPVENNDFETVTEMVTDVHVVSAVIDDDDGDQPTIGAIAIDIDQEPGIEEEIPLFGVIEEIDDEEVLIAKRDNVLIEVSYDIIEVSTEQQTSDEESIVISGILIDLTEQEKQSDAVATDTVTDVIEEPTIIN
ncbi:hypothetical protein PIROE2DRAFT_5147 [Piromyces sp. E2]|nr:hypothetical protein PIROE2DRAFT_5147 [Piromyces sp. E2]|eukprot:OUM67400.1 hypothetical protein PIROE2DRAFT_5147 [Piromyces sp. E2]